MSSNIRVTSIVDRFLEHSRIFYFENACQPLVFLSSADWLPRNFFRRIELAIPIEDGILRDRLINEILAISFSDNVKARRLGADGVYRTVNAAGKSRRSQLEFLALAAEEEDRTVKSVDGRVRKFPQVKLVASPFATTGARK